MHKNQIKKPKQILLMQKILYSIFLAQPLMFIFVLFNVQKPQGPYSILLPNLNNPFEAGLCLAAALSFVLSKSPIFDNTIAKVLRGIAKNTPSNDQFAQKAPNLSPEEVTSLRADFSINIIRLAMLEAIAVVGFVFAMVLEDVNRGWIFFLVFYARMLFAKPGAYAPRLD